MAFPLAVGARYDAAAGVQNHPLSGDLVAKSRLKLVKADTTSSTTGTATAVQELISVNHVFEIIEDSAFFFAGASTAATWVLI